MIAGFKMLKFQVTSKSQALRSVVSMDVLLAVKRSKDADKVMYFMFVISWLTHFFGTLLNNVAKDTFIMDT